MFKNVKECLKELKNLNEDETKGPMLPGTIAYYLIEGDPIRGEPVVSILKDVKWVCFGKGFWNKLVFFLVDAIAITVGPHTVWLNKKKIDYLHLFATYLGAKEMSTIIYHELVHVMQWRQWGRIKFIFNYFIRDGIKGFFKCIFSSPTMFPTPQNIYFKMKTFGVEKEAYDKQYSFSKKIMWL